MGNYGKLGLGSCDLSRDLPRRKESDKKSMPQRISHAGHVLDKKVINKKYDSIHDSPHQSRLSCNSTERKVIKKACLIASVTLVMRHTDSEKIHDSIHDSPHQSRLSCALQRRLECDQKTRLTASVTLVM